MRPLHLKIVATGLLAACAILVTRRAEEPDLSIARGEATLQMKTTGGQRATVRDIGTSKPRASRKPASGESEQSPVGTRSTGMRHQTTSVSPPPVTPDDDKGLSAEEGAGFPPVAGFAHSARTTGIRLGQDVRLPAALMIQSENAPLMDAPPVSKQVAAAREEIATAFYRELADGALTMPTTPGNVSNDPQDESSETSHGGNTVVITPGPRVEDAIARADEIYRALYGDEAYNRHSIGSALEVMLPASAGEGAK